MDQLIIVLTNDVAATRNAAAYQSKIVQRLDLSSAWIVAPREAVGEQTTEDLQQLAAQLWGGDPSGWQATITDNVAAAVQTAIAMDDARHVHVFRSDAMVSPLWVPMSAQGLTQWPIVAPGGPQFPGGQRVTTADGVESFGAACEAAAGQHAGRFVRADWVAPHAFAIDRAKLEELGDLDVELRDLGWALRDFALRCREAGLAIMVAPGVYCYLAGAGPHLWHEDTAGRLLYYRKHAARTVEADHVLAALWVVQPTSRHQLDMLRRSVSAVAGLVDLVHVVLTEHAGRFEEGDGPPNHDTAIERMARPDDVGKAAAAFQRWLQGVAGDARTAVDVISSYPSVQVLEQLATRRTREHGATWCLRLTEADQLEPTTRTELDRLMRHPDPMVVSYNLGIRFAWDSPSLLREDPPFGDGGALTGDTEGTNDWRLYRTNGPRMATDGGRVANLRLRNIGLVDARWRRPGNEDGMIMSRWTDATRVGVHMLAYDGEDPDGLARWLDWTYGLTAEQVVIWTKGDQGVHAFVCEAFGADLVEARQVDGPDFAAWRNVGLAALEERSVTWAWTVDPDEWVDHPVGELLAIRRMAEQTGRHAWAFDFRNLREDRTSNSSQAVRMHRLELGLRYVGRVHETFGDAVGKLRQVYGPRALGKYPHTIHNLGTADHDTGVQKLELYRRLVREELEANPQRSQPWILLGYQYAADGFHAQADACFRQAVQLANDANYLAPYEAAMQHLRQAKPLLRTALARLDNTHAKHGPASELLRSLQPLPDPMPWETEREAPPLPDAPCPVSSSTSERST